MDSILFYREIIGYRVFSKNPLYLVDRYLKVEFYAYKKGLSMPCIIFLIILYPLYFLSSFFFFLKTKQKQTYIFPIFIFLQPLFGDNCLA